MPLRLALDWLNETVLVIVAVCQPYELDMEKAAERCLYLTDQLLNHDLFVAHILAIGNMVG